MSGQGMLVTDDDWVVIMLDPDDGDWSPWTVTAPDLDEAVAKAKNQWRKFCEGTPRLQAQWDNDNVLPPNPSVAGQPDDLDCMVLKVYRGSWIGDRVL